MKSFSWIDIKLGLRMLVKYPWLTIVGGLGMAVAVAIGAGFYGLLYSAMDRTVPLPNGDRLVTIQNWSDSTRSPYRRILHDFYFWRDRVTTMEEVGAFHPAWRNLITPYGDPDPVPIAEITASGFRTAGVSPIMGRYLRDSDEQRDAAPVAVIGEKIWRERYGQDPDILKQTIQVGAKTYRIIGVMPNRYRWPLHHQVWVPLKMRPSEFEPGAGPHLHAFGRLKPGVTLGQAEAELGSIGKQMSAAHPKTHSRIRPTVLPYTYPFIDVDSIKISWAFHGLQVSITLLLVLVCANVATLIYARTAARQGEIAVRSALGASRARIVGQLFAEALVLAAVASIVGIALAKVVLGEFNNFFEKSLGDELPFWMRPEVSSGVVFYTIAVTLIAAAIVGALPAIKATGKRVQGQLRQLGGGSGMLLGKTWTALIVAQVAFAVTILPSTISYTWELARHGFAVPGFPAQQYVTSELALEQPEGGWDPSTDVRERNRAFQQKQAVLVEQLRNESAVAAATIAWRSPGEESTGFIEVEGLPLPKDSIRYSMDAGTRHGYRVRVNRVDSSYFNTFQASLLRGRGFNAADYQGANNVIVNRAFVDQVMKGQNPLDRSFRFLGRGADADSFNMPMGKWFRVVGVVSNFPRNELSGDPVGARVYLPPLPGGNYRFIFLHLAGGTEPEGFIGKLKRLTTSIDPTLQLSDVRSLHDRLTGGQKMMRVGAIALITLTLSVLLLSAAGIYSLMSLAINQRRREIGIRSALGAHPRKILASVFKRATRQLAIGVVLGIGAALLLERVTQGLSTAGRTASLIPFVALMMATVGLLAGIGPARRGLRVQPTEALREL